MKIGLLTAGPSTSLRSGRDDKVGRRFRWDSMLVERTRRSLGYARDDKGNALALPLGFDAWRELQIPRLRSG